MNSIIIYYLNMDFEQNIRNMVKIILLTRVCMCIFHFKQKLSNIDITCNRGKNIDECEHSKIKQDVKPT